MNQGIKDLQEQIRIFCEERDWDQYHGPKDLAIGAVTESSELLELFRFKSESEVKNLMSDVAFRKSMGEELSDILFFVLRFAQLHQIDLSLAFQKKMQKNSERYPVEEFKGKNHKSERKA